MSRAALTDYVAALMWQGQEPCNWFWGGTGDHRLTGRYETGLSLTQDLVSRHHMVLAIRATRSRG